MIIINCYLTVFKVCIYATAFDFRILNLSYVYISTIIKRTVFRPITSHMTYTVKVCIIVLNPTS